MEKMMPKDLTVHIDCDCHTPEHIMRVSTFDWGDDLPPEIEFSIQARNYKPFYKRFWPALKYIFGAELTWDTVCLSEEHEIVKLRQALSTYDAKHKIFLDNIKKKK